MRSLLRFIFGREKPTGRRAVVGNPVSIDVKDVPHITESKKRLAALRELYNRYKNSTHAQNIKSVYEKTERIHTYLLSKNRVNELELFHLQHTDHFLNTFNVIMDAHQQHRQESLVSPVSDNKAAARKTILVPNGNEAKTTQVLEREPRSSYNGETHAVKANVARLTIPDISIDTFANIIYLKENQPDGLTSDEIGFTSTPEEKETFIRYISGKLGVKEITYLGNAMVHIPDVPGSSPPEMVPVIHWNGSPYALYLDDFRLFPVRTYRKSR
ncbi:hypothetical protein [Pontibacter vulgaris]|uniref:hypothetical protein n=1 Tax=Pontibacter vulgaris TaxID=2905679 RepID=UPI001FA7F223|nr:hypothetical protein [Pontibacter vulgaris]